MSDKPAVSDPIIRCAFDKRVAVEDLRPNPRNPNTHGDSQIALLAKIIAHQGWRSPIVVSKRSGFIVAGHGRFEAAKRLGLAKVPVNFQEFDSDADELAHLVADNRIAELAELDDPALVAMLYELQSGGLDMELAGWTKELLEDKTGKFAIDESDLPVIQSGDRSPFRQMTFTLHVTQQDLVERAIATSKKNRPDASPINSNSNGNAITWICQKYLELANG